MDPSFAQAFKYLDDVPPDRTAIQEALYVRWPGYEKLDEDQQTRLVHGLHDILERNALRKRNTERMNQALDTAASDALAYLDDVQPDPLLVRQALRQKWSEWARLNEDERFSVVRRTVKLLQDREVSADTGAGRALRYLDDPKADAETIRETLYVRWPAWETMDEVQKSNIVFHVKKVLPRFRPLAPPIHRQESAETAGHNETGVMTALDFLVVAAFDYLDDKIPAERQAIEDALHVRWPRWEVLTENERSDILFHVERFMRRRLGGRNGD
ncbi:hypothetical protein IWZ01DRAFT_565802 [Phyllosticta capitalensis]